VRWSFTPGREGFVPPWSRSPVSGPNFPRILSWGC
jgi:hypothetical protein